MTAPDPAALPPSPAPTSSGRSTHEQYFGHDHLTVIEPASRFDFLDVREV